MKLKMVITLSALAVASLMSAGQASAAFAEGGYCSKGTGTNGIGVTNMTLNGSNANDCYGTVSIGGDVQNEIGNINALGWGAYSSTNFIKDDASGNVTKDFLGLRWTLAAANGSNDSTYTLTVQDLDPSNAPGLPLTVDIVGFLKAATPGAFYYFSGALIDTSNNGTFKIVWTTRNSVNNPGLSGLSLFIGSARDNQVPEPGSLTLLGVGLLMLAGLARRRAAPH